jgi:HK97 family phage portal protein
MGEAISQYLKKVIQEKAIELTKQKGISSLVDDAKIYRSLRSYLASSDAIEVNDPYEKSVWVFASINAIAQNIARVPFYLYQEKKKNLKTIINEGPLYELFTNPNPYMITSTLMFATVLFMELYGEAFWVLEGRDNITQIPKEIWCINPTRFSPVIDKDHQFKGFWEYSVRDSKVIFAPHEILQFKYFNPYDDIRGTSGLEASRLGVEQDYLAGKYNKQFFKDGISLSGLVQTPDFLTDEQYNRLKNQFEERHAGYGNAHKVGIIEGGATFAETKVMSQRDMEFSVLKTVIRGEILAAFKTNEVVLGNYENIQSYEGIKQAHESFWKETLLPKIIYLEDFLWAKFFSKIQNGKTWGGYDTSVIEALREDYRNKVEMAEILSKMGYPLNSINKRLDMGFEDVPWGNTWFVRMGTVPVEYVLENPNPKPSEPTEEPGNAPDDDEEEPGNAPDEEDDEEPKEEPNEGKDLRDNSVWSSFISRQIPVENMFKSKIKRFLYEQRKRALANLFNKIEILNEEEEKKKLVVILNSLYEVANVTGKELLKEELFLEEIEYPEIFKSIQDRVEFSSSTIIKTINNSLMKLLNDNDSKDIQAKAQLIRTFYNKTDNKVSIIARTESAAIINLVRFIIMQNQGVKHHKWISRLEHSRHIKFNNKIVRIGESFSEDFVIRYPHDKKAPVGETVGCLCFTVPVVKYK